MTDIDENIRRVREFIRKNGPVATAVKAGLARGTLRGFDSEEWNPTADTLRKVLELMAGQQDAAA